MTSTESPESNRRRGSLRVVEVLNWLVIAFYVLMLLELWLGPSVD